ncbi:hypothetical protein BN12_80017 [Nostocoides japonicum T1-X7]|uniref:Aldehyde dehydrogenase domain-containing protein n=1 Tax=Nostocoides japonicum T1-X7 TaxID=1194083 RepID=A0A077M396_9MICO|nr:hypothetical protein BN12_80017 [Tetrasphaera japonica T1-X7]
MVPALHRGRSTRHRPLEPHQGRQGVNLVGAEHRLRTEDLPPGGALIAGVWRDQQLTMPVRDPENAELVGYVHPCSSADVDEAVRAGLAALDEDWPLHLRAAALRQTASAVLDQRERFARVIAAEGVKTVREARGEVQRCAETLNTAADSTDVLIGETLPLRRQRARVRPDRLVQPGAPRRRRRHQQLQRPPQPRRAQGRPGPAGGRSDRAQALGPDTVLGSQPRRGPARRGCSRGAGLGPVRRWRHRRGPRGTP